jgi:hypothetical protein
LAVHLGVDPWAKRTPPMTKMRRIEAGFTLSAWLAQRLLSKATQAPVAISHRP